MRFGVTAAQRRDFAIRLARAELDLGAVVELMFASPPAASAPAWSRASSRGRSA